MEIFRRSVSTLVAAAVICLALAASCFAASDLTLKTKAGPLAAGAELTFRSKNLTLSYGELTLKCKATSLDGVLQSNELATDAGIIESAFFGKACSDLGVHPALFPWLLDFTNKGGFTLKDTEIGVFYPQGKICIYGDVHKEIAGTFPTKGKVTVALADQSLEFIGEYEAPPLVECPRTAELNATFSVVAKVGSKSLPVEAEL